MAMNERVMSELAKVVKEFLEAFESSGDYLRGRVSRLASLATAEDIETAELATGAFFKSLVERLADSFDSRAVSLYNRVFAQLIQHCREVDRSGALNGELMRFGLVSEDDIRARAETIRRKQWPAWLCEAGLEMRRIIVLSRVTLGADVAITSVMIEGMKRAFPKAEITLVGGRKAVELFGGDARLSFKEIGYRRVGGTLERLFSWIDLLDCVRKLTGDLRRGQYLIVDPDSRLTQLGLLPLSDEDYLFFPSREYGGDTSQSLGQLTSAWLDEVFGLAVRLSPKVSLARADLIAAGELMRRIRRGSKPVIAINFGVGENVMKRVEGDFETRLVNGLIQGGATIIFDKGAGADEMRRANEVIGNAARTTRAGRGVRVVEVNEENLKALVSSDKVDADLIVWGGRIGMLAALISESDLYTGYDSAGQHIAAALGVPCVDVFAGFSSPRMLDRWRPEGKAEARVIAVDSQARSNPQAVLADVLRHINEIALLKNC
jgi:ADP-heptose:LPS heptosyltransferase